MHSALSTGESSAWRTDGTTCPHRYDQAVRAAAVSLPGRELQASQPGAGCAAAGSSAWAISCKDQVLLADSLGL